jgi:hypothetical protein
VSADVLREAARVMRDAWGAAAEVAEREAAKPRPANHHVGTLAPTMVAVANWLDRTASAYDFAWDDLGETPGLDDGALAVARAYLGMTP